MELTSNGESSLTMALVLQRHKLGTDALIGGRSFWPALVLKAWRQYGYDEMVRVQTKEFG